MLILSRKIGESIVIQVGDKKIKFTVVEMNNGNIKIGFEAPKDIKIYRNEVYEEIVTQNKASILSSVDKLKVLSESMPNRIKKAKNIKAEEEETDGTK